MKRVIYILLLLTAASPAIADDPKADDAPARLGSVARQLQLKFRLLRDDTGADGKPSEKLLAQRLNHNREVWRELSPDQRELFRREALAMIGRSPEEQARLIKHYDRLVRMTAEKRRAYIRRALWLRVVVDSFSDEQKQALERMSAEQRARTLLDRKAELIEQGVLAPDEPTSRPAASEPATRPIIGEASQPAESQPKN